MSPCERAAHFCTNGQSNDIISQQTSTRNNDVIDRLQMFFRLRSPHALSGVRTSEVLVLKLSNAQVYVLSSPCDLSHGGSFRHGMAIGRGTTTPLSHLPY